MPTFASISIPRTNAKLSLDLEGPFALGPLIRLRLASARLASSTSSPSPASLPSLPPPSFHTYVRRAQPGQTHGTIATVATWCYRYLLGPNWVVDRWMIAKAYARSWLLIDALSSFPVEIFDLIGRKEEVGRWK